ncbi:alpha/beta hydrolase [Kribbella alba]|uniref:alpha/beta fold hydrolase n=1 Tax=Kribbella alba TaxID=190197 RepID=UPI0031D9C2CB
MISVVDDLPVYYESYGEGRPLVFLPGWGNANGEAQDVHEPVFEQHPDWRRIYLDPPGTGNTPSRPWIKDQDGMLDVIARVIDDLVGSSGSGATGSAAAGSGAAGWGATGSAATGSAAAGSAVAGSGVAGSGVTGSFAIAGTSAGGLHARGIVRRDPARILGLLLRVPGVVVDRTQRTLPEYRPLIAEPRFSSDEDPRPLLHTPEYLEAHREKQRRFYLPAEEQADLEFLGAIQRDVSTYSLSMDPAARLEAPTLIVTGRQDTMTGYADAWSLLGDYPRATYAVLDRADHDLPVQNHALYRALVSDWLTRVEEMADAS